MLNGKLKDHQELWQALVKVEKMFATVLDEVTITTLEICDYVLIGHGCRAKRVHHSHCSNGITSN